MDNHIDLFHLNDLTDPPPPTPLVMAPNTGTAAPPREKTKRPQLSCNPCRARKVKCDRIQPCTACSLHQIAEICHYDLSEQERQPILQAEALKEKDKAIAHLQNELQVLRGNRIKEEPLDEDDDFDNHHPARKMRLPPRSLKRTGGPHEEQQQMPSDAADASLFLGHPGVTNVVDEFAHLSFDRLSASLPMPLNRGEDLFSCPMATSHPFPTLWTAKDDTSTIIRLLPPEEDLFSYVDAFQRRARALSFPYVPDDCTHQEIRQFLDNVEHNAALHPDMLALLFTTLALGLQDGVYDRCGERWVPGGMESEAKKGDVYIAAAMQCLRLSSFLNRPTLRAIEALVMMGPYLTNTGKFLDASALFGGTIRLAQSINLHRDPDQLTPPALAKESAARKHVWWWLLNMDQQYSMTLGRPLGISSMGDCPSPESTIPNPNAVSLSNYISHFSLLARQILSSGTLSNTQIDKYSDDLLSLHSTLTAPMQLDATWLDEGKAPPPWPLDAQASLLHAKTHNLLILLNRQRVEPDKDRARREPTSHNRFARINSHANQPVRGRERVLQSCRSLLMAFEFMKKRCEAALTCWTMGQMAFNAAMLLTLSMLETGETKDLLPLQHVYSAFLDMNKMGIHKLAGAAVDRLGALMKEFHSEDFATQTVMGHQVMMLLEDHGLPITSPSEGFVSSISDQIAATGGSGFNPSALLRAATNQRPRTESSPFPRKRTGARKQGGSSSRESHHKNNSQQQQRASKKAAATTTTSSSSGSKAVRQSVDRRFSDSVTPRPQQRRRTNRGTPNTSLMTPQQQHPGQGVFSANTTAPSSVKNETLFPTQTQTYEGYPTTTTPHYAATNHNHNHNPNDLRLNLDSLHHTHPHHHHQSNMNPHHHHHHAHHHAATSSTTDSATNNDFNFSTQSTPYSSEFFDDSLHSSLDHSPFEPQHHHHHSNHHSTPGVGPFSAPSGPFGGGAGGDGGVGGFGTGY